ncbi:MAG TPA: hypothetical protein VHM92_11405 [Allosphingosinicella sp.]|nr:hypothetical protein [Allosphingosinicella sp.]
MTLILFGERIKGLGCTVDRTGVERCTLLYQYVIDTGAALDISLFFLGLPVVLGLLARWGRKAFLDLLSESVREMPGTPDILRDQLAAGRISTNDTARVLRTCALYHDGVARPIRGEFGDFLNQELERYHAGGSVSYRSGMNSSFVLGNPTADSRLIPFREAITYAVEAEAGDMFAVDAFSSVYVDEASVREALSRWRLTIDVDDFRYDLTEHLESLDAEKLIKSGRGDAGAGKIQFDGRELSLVVQSYIKLRSHRPTFRKVENGYVEPTDQSSTAVLRAATRGVTVTVQLPTAYVIDNIDFTPTVLQRQAAVSLSQDRSLVMLSHDGWLMPGICSVITWRDRQGDM